MKSKTFVALITLVLTAITFSGCSNNESGNADTTAETSQSSGGSNDLSGTITVLTQRTDLVDSKFKEYVTKFNEKHPNVTVSFEAITNYENDVAIRMSTTEYGDVLVIPNSVSSNDFATFFEPLGEVEEMSKDYDFITAKISGGMVYGLPSNANAQGIVYNKKVFSDAGITELPKTPDEFLDALKQIKEKTSAIPYYTNYAAGWPLTAWEDHAWGSITGDADYHNNGIVNEKDPFSSGKSHYVLYKLLYDIVNQSLCENDPVTTDWEKSKGMINNGEIGCMLLGSWAVSQMKEAGDNADDIGYMAFPNNIDGKQYATAGADYCYAINVNSKNKEAARAWIDFMVHDSGFALSEGCISCVKGSELPSTLADFKDVELINDNPATSENDGKFDKLSNESEIGLYAEKEKQRIVEAAMGSSSESFDDIMNDWNERWNKALDEY